VALRGTLREGYSFAKFRADLMAGVIVGIVALPLSMALAIASGVPPQHGLYTAIVAGAVIAVTGGSRHNVSGPTAAFVVLLAPVSARFGLGGLALASAMAGVILLGMGLFKLGRLVQFVPHPVTTGFTAGIAVVIATLQLKDFLGLTYVPSGDHYWERVADIAGALGSFNWPDLAVGAFSLALLIVWPRVTRRVPGPLVAVIFGSVVAYFLNTQIAGATVATIGSRFGGIPQQLPAFVLPWTEPGGDGSPLGLSMDLVRSLIGPAFAIAALGAIESLLSAVVADGMAGSKHDPDSELVGQGLGNVAAAFFGGFAATGAIARTATGIRAGGKSPFTAVIHAAFVFAAVMALAPILSYLPMASMAAMLLVVAWNMSDARHFMHMLRVAPRSDLSVLLICFGLTVAFDMVVAVSIGIVLAALLFMRRMAEISGARVVNAGSAKLRAPLPPGVILYEIAGPLFFGAADKAVGNIAGMAADVKVVVLDMSAVPAMDVTGLVALESVLKKLKARGVRVIVGGLQPQPQRVMAKAQIVESPGELRFCVSLDQAIEEARRAAG
jgi:SulP family sulfate permease